MEEKKEEEWFEISFDILPCAKQDDESIVISISNTKSRVGFRKNHQRLFNCLRIILNYHAYAILILRMSLSNKVKKASPIKAKNTILKIQMRFFFSIIDSTRYFCNFVLHFSEVYSIIVGFLLRLVGSDLH